MRKIILFSSALFLTTCQAADDVTIVENYFKNMTDFQGDLEIISPNGKKSVNGIIKIRRPNILKIEYKNGNLITINGNNITHFNKKLNEVTKHKKHPFSAFLKKDVNFRQKLSNIQCEKSNGVLNFSFKPDIKGVGIDNITLSFCQKPMELRKISIKYENGQENIMMISNIKRKIEDSDEKLLAVR